MKLQREDGQTAGGLWADIEAYTGRGITHRAITRLRPVSPGMRLLLGDRVLEIRAVAGRFPYLELLCREIIRTLEV